MARRAGTGAEAAAPPWLEPLLATTFFASCTLHGDAARGECNMFCLDCPSAGAFCFYCRSSAHADHRSIQIRRSSYHDVVRVSEVQRALDVSGVQNYVINSARVVFLNERPQPKGTSSSSSGIGGAAKSAAHLCEICSRTLLDPVRFCSLGCKLEGIKRTGGGATFLLDDDGSGGGGGGGGDGGGVGQEPTTSAPGTGGPQTGGGPPTAVRTSPPATSSPPPNPGGGRASPAAPRWPPKQPPPVGYTQTKRPRPPRAPQDPVGPGDAGPTGLAEGVR